MMVNLFEISSKLNGQKNTQQVPTTKQFLFLIDIATETIEYYKVELPSTATATKNEEKIFIIFY